MFSRFFSRPRPSRRLHPDDVHRIVRQFLDHWSPYHERYGQTGDISVDWIKDKNGNRAWVATIIPARDIRCGVRINDEDGEVVEAELVAMLRKAVVAHWQRSQSP